MVFIHNDVRAQQWACSECRVAYERNKLCRNRCRKLAATLRRPAVDETFMLVAIRLHSCAPAAEPSQC